MGWQEVNYLPLSPSLSDSSPLLALSPLIHIFFQFDSLSLFEFDDEDVITLHALCFLDVLNVVPSLFFFIFQSKRKFERECKEAEKSQMTYDRLDNDINATKSEVEKVGRSREAVNWCDK